MAEDSTPPVIDFEKLLKRPRTRLRSDDFVSIYSNSMNVEMTFNDFTVYFGELVEATPEKLVTKDKVSVIMGPEEVKSVVEVLARQVEQYEAVFGPIRRIPGTSPPQPSKE